MEPCGPCGEVMGREPAAVLVPSPGSETRVWWFTGFRGCRQTEQDRGLDNRFCLCRSLFQGFLQQLRQIAGRLSSGPRGAGLGVKLLMGAGALAYGVKEATYTGNALVWSTATCVLVLWAGHWVYFYTWSLSISHSHTHHQTQTLLLRLNKLM